MAGATTYVLGVTAFGVGIAAGGRGLAYAADPDAVLQAQGAPLLAYMGEHADRYVVGVLAGLVLTSVGAIALCIALLRARTVHWIIPIVLLAGILANLVLPFGVVGLLISTAATTIPMLAIGWYAARMR